MPKVWSEAGSTGTKNTIDKQKKAAAVKTAAVVHLKNTNILYSRYEFARVFSFFNALLTGGIMMMTIVIAASTKMYSAL